MSRTEPLNSPLLLLDGNGELRQRSWKLSVVSGPDAGKTLDLTETVVVGSGIEADLQLSDGTVSRLHVQLEPQADGVRVKDLGSTNGTLMGGARIGEALVEHHGTLSMGRSVLSVAATDVAIATGEGPATLDGLVGSSPQMRHLFSLVEKLAPTDTPIILLGETGTGKEGLARGLHLRSKRRLAPFVVVDCGAITSALIESELFGHARGAFTGAATERPGAFVEAEGGTLFLDEIGELPLELQPKLLRALEARQVKRLGEDRYRSVDVRIIAATHRDLEAETRAGRFRQDLYYRLAVAALRVPPLRERREDIPLLVTALLSQLGSESFSLSGELLQLLGTYDWPGNVRELRNVVARAVVSDAISIQSVLNPHQASAPEQAASPQVPFKAAKDHLVDTFTLEYLTALSRKFEGNVTKMARASGLARTYLYGLLGKYGLRGA